MNKVGVKSLHDNKAFRCCCGCMHVKPGTIVYGLICLVIDLFAVALLVVLSLHPDVLRPNRIGQMDKVLDDMSESDKTWSRFTEPDQAWGSQENRRWLYVFLGISILAAAAMLYGVIRKRPCCILPFFCLQVLSFCVSALTLLTFCAFVSHADMQEYLSTSRTAMVTESEEMEGTFNKDMLTVISFAALVLNIIWRANLMCMVWKCYRYVELELASRCSVRHYQVDPDTELLLPPLYEDVVTQQDLTPPPPYSQ